MDGGSVREHEDVNHLASVDDRNELSAELAPGNGDFDRIFW
jgi:hypothetical protein